MQLAREISLFSPDGENTSLHAKIKLAAKLLIPRIKEAVRKGVAQWIKQLLQSQLLTEHISTLGDDLTYFPNGKATLECFLPTF